LYKEKEKLLDASIIEALRVRSPPIGLDLSCILDLMGSSYPFQIIKGGGLSWGKLDFRIAFLGELC
jgi:hypothetical protein